MLLEMAIADAYGAGFEFKSYELIKKYNTAQGYVNHSGSRLPLGHYTDDTQMALALSELMLSDKKWTPENIAQSFVDCFHRDPRKGYARGFYHFLKQTHSGKEFIQNIRPHSEKSGGAMRSAPLGFFPNIQEVIEKTTIQAKLTHNTKNGITSSLAVALASHYFIYNLGTKKDLPQFLSSHISGDWKTPWTGQVSIQGMDCAKGAISAILASNTFSSLLIRCIDYTGDTDTVACIAFGIASHCQEIENDWSDILFNGLENGEFGRDYLQGIDEALNSKFIGT